MPTKIKAICWDIDGTLVDTEPLYEDTLRTVAALHGESFPLGVSLEGVGARSCWQWLVENRGLAVPLEQFLEECAEHYVAHPEKIVPRAGAPEACAYFASLLLPQCAVSGGVRDQVDTNLGRSGLADKMLFAVSANDVENSKPHPEPYLLARAALCRIHDWEEKPEDAACYLAIEDSMGGILSAKRAGMTAIYWSKDGVPCAAADYNVSTPEELMALCRKLTAPEPAANPGATPAVKPPRP